MEENSEKGKLIFFICHRITVCVIKKMNIKNTLALPGVIWNVLYNGEREKVRVVIE